MYKTVLNPSDLPVIPSNSTLYLDCETSNITDKGKPADSMVWHGDKIVGVAVTHNDCPDCWYIPVRHTNSPNLRYTDFIRWLKHAFKNTKTWVNHNIKFDMHFVAKDMYKYQRNFDINIVDTMVQARLIHNNLKSYGLKELSVKYLGVENWKDVIKDWLLAYKTKNWANVPVELMALYACKDVDNNRKLHFCFNTLMPTECEAVWRMEQLLTPVLYDLEVQGMLIDLDELAVESQKSLDKQEKLQSKLDGLIGRTINVNSSPQLKELLIGELKLPIVATTDKGNPSFNAEAMGLYDARPEVLSNFSIRSTLKAVAALVTETHFYNLFLKEYTNLHVDGVVHPTYLQCKKTGRMGCKQPNSQQLNNRAKKLVKCLPGHNIWSWDYSQVEYRLIAHYTKNQKAIAAYQNDSNTDYHQWVAELAGIARKPAKTLNFLMAFGGGKGKAMEFLAKIEDVIKEVNVAVDLKHNQASDSVSVVYQGIAFTNRADLFQYIFTEKAERIYNQYHAAQPELKRTMYQVAGVVERRGYVRTAMSRRNYIPKELSYKAFNAVIQGSAADIAKGRAVAYSPRYNKTVRDWGIKPFTMVHDDFLSQVPCDIDETQYIDYTTKVLQDVPFELAVPIIVNREKHLENWGE